MDVRDRLTLPEQLLLLALDPRSGRLPDASNVSLGLAGAVLAELDHAGAVRAAADGRRIERAASAAPSDPLLGAALERVAFGDAVRTGSWLGRTARGLHRAYLQRLVERGLVKPVPHKVLGLFPTVRHPVRDRDALREARARVDGVAKGRKTALTDREAVRLASLTGACRLERRLYRGSENRSARARLATLAKEDWIAKAVLKKIREKEAAVHSGGGG